ncbi:MAG: cytochrome c [Gammaproteobacteria bacterium]|nr:cytochrome c [Gammaproteobacteria bacterium]MCW8987769.1 cytochrome c [Gammaproteobacteria bacterium]MCW9029893.1 cytochrome c [Gammaproteobacteria bacterium]
MKIISFISLLSFILLSTTAAANNEHKEGIKLYVKHCISCHGTEGGMDMSKRVAPPAFAVKMHYIGTYADKDSFVMAIADWLENRDADNSMMPGAVLRFGVMPAVKVTRDEVEKIAAYIFEGDLESPEGFQQHYEDMHGKK